MIRRFAIAAALIATLALVFIGIARWNGSTTPRATALRTREQTPPPRVTPQRSAWPSAPTPAGIANDHARSAMAWQERARRVIEAQHARQFGTDVAALLTEPPSDAWRDLRTRADAGDVRAAAAAMLVASECQVLSSAATTAPSQHSSFIDRLATRPLPDGWSEFLRTVDAEEVATRDARTQSCIGVGGTMDFALMVLDRYIHPDDAQVQLAEAADETDDDTAIADLRRLADGADASEATRTLGIRLLRSHDPQQRLEGLALLLPLANDDADLAAAIARCYRDSCVPEASAGTASATWLERAAGLGSPWALDTQIADLVAARRLQDAWAWSLYRLDLALAGCFQAGQPSMITLALYAADAFRLQQDLTSSEQAQARATEQGLAARWQTQATSALDCAP